MVGDLRRTSIRGRCATVANQTPDNEVHRFRDQDPEGDSKSFRTEGKPGQASLALLEKAETIEQADGGYRSTPIGMAYLKHFQAFAPDQNGDRMESRGKSG
jgi:hypothetical protein